MENKEIQQQDEISLKELILAIWSQKWLVLGIAFIVALGAFVYAFFIASPSYEARTELMMRQPESVSTQYGTYTFPSTRLSDYINYIYSAEVANRVIEKNGLELSLQGYRNMISVSQTDNSNQFSVTITHGDPVEAYQISNDVVDAFIRTIRIKYKTDAVESLLLDHDISMEQLINNMEKERQVLVQNQLLLDAIEPVYTLRKMLLSDPEAAALYADRMNLDIESLSEQYLSQEYINANYFKVESSIVDSEMRLIRDGEEYNQKQQFVNELEQEQILIKDLLGTQNEDYILNGRLDVLSQNIMVISPATVPESPVAPRKMMILAIGMVLGAMLGVFAGFFRHYWKNS